MLDSIIEKIKTKEQIKNIIIYLVSALFLSIAAQISIPFPGEVPMTLQTFSIALIGFTLTKNNGIKSIITYLLLGVIGLPVFAGGATFVGYMLITSILQTYCEEKLTKIKNLEKESRENKLEEINKELTKEIVLSKNGNDLDKDNSQEIEYYLGSIILYCMENNLIRKEVFTEWQNYLKNTLIDKESINFIDDLIKKLELLNTSDLSSYLEVLKQDNDMLDLLIYFSRNGDRLAQLLNREIPELKKERVLNQ